jgi:(2S)-methylsuccinyl-CoA dehydrogenase
LGSAHRSELAAAVAQAAAVDRSAEGFHAAFDDVAREALGGCSASDAGLAEEHVMFRRSLRDFADRHLRPAAQAIHREDRDVPDEVIRGVAGLGLFGLSIPEAYGGVMAEPRPCSDADWDRRAVGGLAGHKWQPDDAPGDPGPGSAERRHRRAETTLAAGDSARRGLVAVAVTEPDVGSDVAQVQCRAARRSDGSWEITGTKLWYTFAGRAQLLMLLCRTGARDSGHRGLSVFVVEKPSFGGRHFEVLQPEGGKLTGRAIPTIGYRGLHTFELVFDRYLLPPEALVSEPGRGLYLQMEGFATGRLQTAARAVGVMQAAVRDTLAYARERHVFGRRIVRHPVAHQMLGRMVCRLEASRQLSHWAASLLDGGEGQAEASLAKLYASRMAEYVTRDATQLFGGMGYGEETDVSSYFVDAPVLAIFEALRRCWPCG